MLEAGHGHVMPCHAMPYHGVPGRGLGPWLQDAHCALRLRVLFLRVCHCLCSPQPTTHANNSIAHFFCDINFFSRHKILTARLDYTGMAATHDWPRRMTNDEQPHLNIHSLNREKMQKSSLRLSTCSFKLPRHCRREQRLLSQQVTMPLSALWF